MVIFCVQIMLGLTNKPFAFGRFQSHHLNRCILVVPMNNILNVGPYRQDRPAQQVYLEAPFTNHATIRHAFIIATRTLNTNTRFYQSDPSTYFISKF